MGKRAAALLLMAAGCGCAIHVLPPEPLQPPPGGPAGLPAPEAWASALSRFVDDEGRVDFEAIRADSRDLDHVVAQAAWMSPESDPDLFPTQESRLAYYLNTYNALAMRHAALSGVEPGSKARFFYRTEFTVGGRYLSLDDLENEVLRPMGEPRVHFALNRMTRSAPRLHREPFAARELEAQLDRAAREFLNDPRRVQADPARKTVRLSAILKWYKKDFLKAAPSLVDYANRYREAKIPGDFRVEFLPYDWTLNARPRQGPAAAPRAP